MRIHTCEYCRSKGDWEKLQWEVKSMSKVRKDVSTYDGSQDRGNESQRVLLVCLTRLEAFLLRNLDWRVQLWGFLEYNRPRST